MCEEGNGLSASYIFSCELIMLFELVLMCLFFSFSFLFAYLPPCLHPLESLAHITLLSSSIGLSFTCVKHVTHEVQLYVHV